MEIGAWVKFHTYRGIFLGPVSARSAANPANFAITSIAHLFEST
jgi:hypothetical protein